MAPSARCNRGRQSHGGRAFPQSSLEKRHEHSSHRFHSQGVTSPFVLQSIEHFEIPRGKRKIKKEKKKKSEERKVITIKGETKNGSGCACWQGHVLLALPQPSPQY